MAEQRYIVSTDHGSCDDESSADSETTESKKTTTKGKGMRVGRYLSFFSKASTRSSERKTGSQSIANYVQKGLVEKDIENIQGKARPSRKSITLIHSFRAKRVTKRTTKPKLPTISASVGDIRENVLHEDSDDSADGSEKIPLKNQHTASETELQKGCKLQTFWDDIHKHTPSWRKINRHKLAERHAHIQEQIMERALELERERKVRVDSEDKLLEGIDQTKHFPVSMTRKSSSTSQLAAKVSAKGAWKRIAELQYRIRHTVEDRESQRPPRSSVDERLLAEAHGQTTATSATSHLHNVKLEKALKLLRPKSFELYRACVLLVATFVAMPFSSTIYYQDFFHNDLEYHYGDFAAGYQIPYSSIATFGILASGVIADMFGRRKLILCAIACCLTCDILGTGAFYIHTAVFVIMRAIYAFFVGMLFNISTVYALEASSARNRWWSVILTKCFAFYFGFIYMLACSKWMPSDLPLPVRMVLCDAPLIAGGSILLIHLCDSVRWLFSQNRIGDMLQAMETIEKWNGVDEMPAICSLIIVPVKKCMISRTLLCSFKIHSRISVLVLACFLAHLAFRFSEHVNSLLSHEGSEPIHDILAAKVPILTLLLASAEAFFFLNIPRVLSVRILTISHALFFALVLAVMAFVDIFQTNLGFHIVGIACTATLLSRLLVMYLMLLEITPTAFRAFAVGTVMFLAEITYVITNLIYADGFPPFAVMVVLLVLSVCCVPCSFFVLETFDANLPDFGADLL